MFIVSHEVSKALRRKRADLMITKQEVAKEVGVDRKTYSQIENNNKVIVHQATYEKLTEWLVKDYI